MFSHRELLKIHREEAFYTFDYQLKIVCTFDCKFFHQPLIGCQLIAELRKFRDHAPGHGRTKPQYCQEEQDQEGCIMDAVQAIILRYDNNKYFIIYQYHNPDIDINLRHTYTDYSLNTVITIWLDFNNTYWSVEASSHHSEDGRRPETSGDTT